MMSPLPTTLTSLCAICGRPTVDFNYGVLSCNACKVFFRRMITRTAPLKKCHLGEKCFEGSAYAGIRKSLKCQFCRFQKCLTRQMTLPSYLLISEPNKEKCLSSVLHLLRDLDTTRKNYLFKFITRADSDPNIDEILKMEKIEYVEKPEDHPMTFNNWAFHSSLITVDFMKKFAFINLLKTEDQKIVIKECYIKLGAFISSTRAYTSKKAVLSFPDGTDLLPKTEWIESKIPENLKKRIRSRLVGRLAELEITHEEFLLLSVLIFCNPAIANLSENGKFLLSLYQQMYSSALFQYCMIHHGKNGPTRYTDLLGLCHVIGKHYDDVINFYILLQLFQSRVQVSNIVKDGIDAAYNS